MPDTALKTFEVAQDRANYLVRLAAGLTDRRRRSARSDWASTFKKVMHWSQSTKVDRIDGKDALVVVWEEGDLAREDFSAERLHDLYRAAIVMSVSAMDAYFHAKVLRYVIAHSKSAEPSSALLKTRITVADFVAGNAKKRRNTALRAALGRIMSFQSYQSPENVASALSKIGVQDFWNGVSAKLGRSSEEIRGVLSDIVKRRNQIAHEGDLSQSKKARNKPRRIEPKLARDYLQFIEGLVHASEEHINEQLGI
jgi:hypothetical protein